MGSDILSWLFLAFLFMGDMLQRWMLWRMEPRNGQPIALPPEARKLIAVFVAACMVGALKVVGQALDSVYQDWKFAIDLVGDLTLLALAIWIWRISRRVAPGAASPVALPPASRKEGMLIVVPIMGLNFVSLGLFIALPDDWKWVGFLLLAATMGCMLPVMTYIRLRHQTAAHSDETSPQ